MHVVKLAIVLLIPLLTSCQHWSDTIDIPPDSAPAAPVAADTTRENTPERNAVDEFARVPSPIRRAQDFGTDLEQAIDAYLTRTTIQVHEDGESLYLAAKRSTEESTVDIWDRIRRGFNLEHHLDRPSVQAELNWYKRHPAYLDRVAARARRHLFHIVEAIEERDLPMEVGLLPIVESAFDPFAYSHGRAAGLWQFIPGTARHYDLQINWWYDGRRDVPEATRAALDYLAHLHQLLDDNWLLALAAYNAGQGNVRQAMKANSRAGKPTDFWSLNLLPETRVYVPRLLAISALVADPQKYGIQLTSLPNTPYWEAVDIGSQLDLAKAASLAEISVEELYLLNPAFNQWSTRPNGPHRLLVPREKAASFRDRLKSLSADERVAWRRHTVRPGESLGVLARRHQTSIAAIKTANNLRSNLIRAGDALLIPVASHDRDTYSHSKEERLARTREYVEDKKGVAPVNYTVRPGDSFWEIARRFGVEVRSLAKWNGMAPTDILSPGTKLTVFSTSASRVSEAPQNSEVIRKVSYRVRRGESLSLIASKFNLSVASIRQWNDDLAQRKYIHPGDQLTLFVDVTSTQ
ncbi:MAG: LysM peptidoglycan-binding domain-containing protein [Pseudomonadales bacterium]